MVLPRYVVVLGVFSVGGPGVQQRDAYIEYHGCSAVGVQEDERIGEGDEPWRDEGLGGLALLRVMVHDESLPSVVGLAGHEYPPPPEEVL